MSYFSFAVGDGSIVFSPRQDWWCEEAPLRELFCALFALALYRDYQQRVSDVDIWSHIFVRDDFVGDDTLVSFFNKVNEVKLGDSFAPCMIY